MPAVSMSGVGFLPIIVRDGTKLFVGIFSVSKTSCQLPINSPCHETLYTNLKRIECIIFDKTSDDVLFNFGVSFNGQF